MTSKGISYEVEPEDRDSIVFVDFEEAPDDWGDDKNARIERRDWHRAAVTDVFAAIGVTNPARTADIYFDAYIEDGEEELWSRVERVANQAGFDTYDSDSRFELYDPNDGNVDAAVARHDGEFGAQS